MIITQTPLRISFAGGGTDFQGYYAQGGGAVLSTAIDKYIYVVIKQRFDNKIRVGYTRTEMVDSVDQIEHELVRECLRLTGITGGVEIATMADIPSQGSGLGSSSTVTVGLLHAMYAHQGVLVTAETLAAEACKIEIEILGKPIGKQDQYIAAYGNLRRFEFRADGSVAEHTVELSAEKRMRFGESLMLFYTGITRQADVILTEQKANIEDKRVWLDRIKAQVPEVEAALIEGNLNKVGRLMQAPAGFVEVPARERDARPGGPRRDRGSLGLGAEVLPFARGRDAAVADGEERVARGGGAAAHRGRLP